MKIVIISGSPRKGSLSKRVALHLKSILSGTHDINLIALDEISLPFIQSVFSSEEKTPAEFVSLRNTMTKADAFIFVTPEYNGGYSPALKNLIDHFPKIAYARKAIGIVTSSDGMFGGIRASQQMQQLICALFGIPLPQMLIVPQANKKFDENGNLTDETFNRNIDNFIAEFNWLAESLLKSR